MIHVICILGVIDKNSSYFPWPIENIYDTEFICEIQNLRNANIVSQLFFGSNFFLNIYQFQITDFVNYLKK